MSHVHIHVHTNDAGTSEGARKAAITRKQRGGSAAPAHGSPDWHFQQAKAKGQLLEGMKRDLRRTPPAHQPALEADIRRLHGEVERHTKGYSPHYRSPGSDGSVEETMHEYKHGELRSRSKKGPKVKSRKQAIAIALSQAGKSNKDSATKDFLPG